MSVPRLSVVVIGFNMARELPRTVKTLSPMMQRDISAGDYEIIVVDNGSTDALDVSSLLRLGSNISYHRIASATASPVPAINYGLARARGHLIGVMIDGARMASPRLLATALDASRLDPGAVIGTLAFHLGPDMQLRSVAKGYCQEEEDRLLASIDWESDGYRLFSISVFAGSSEDGWFVIPAETNALFLTKEQWDQLGGYDPAFRSPGGGLANLDTWARACAHPGWRVVMLLGEATFHQVHGGVATNARGESKWKEFHDEYVRIRGSRYVRLSVSPTLVGQLHSAALASVAASAARMQSFVETDSGKREIE